MNSTVCVCVRDSKRECTYGILYMCVLPVLSASHAGAETCKHVGLFSWLLPSFSPLLFLSFFFFNSLRIFAKGGRLELLGGGRLGEWQHPVEHNEGGNGAAGQARNPSLHASQTTKIVVRQV